MTAWSALTRLSRQRLGAAAGCQLESKLHWAKSSDFDRQNQELLPLHLICHTSRTGREGKTG
eukprot:7440646-Alexandrium_andersonii.AAC.1